MFLKQLYHFQTVKAKLNKHIHNNKIGSSDRERERERYIKLFFLNTQIKTKTTKT